MDRLTKRNKDGSVGINAFRYYNHQDFQKLATKLADYEDIGTVEKFKELKEKEQQRIYTWLNDNRIDTINEFLDKLLECAPKNYAGDFELGDMSCYLSAIQVKKIAEKLINGE